MMDQKESVLSWESKRWSDFQKNLEQINQNNSFQRARFRELSDWKSWSGFEEFSKPEDKKHTDYLPDLIELEQIISAEIFRLKEELEDELIDEISREATERALKDNEGLLVSLKKLQRDQIQRKIEIKIIYNYH